MFGVTNFSAPLLAEAGGGLVWLITAGGGCVSVVSREDLGTGWAGFEGASGGTVAGAS
jgi:hypothetical protein